jgi:hypothetical protein
LHALHGMLGQQLQDADVLPRSRRGTVTFLHGLPKLGELRGHLPIPVDLRVIQRRRATSQGGQIWLCHGADVGQRLLALSDRSYRR